MDSFIVAYTTMVADQASSSRIAGVLGTIRNASILAGVAGPIGRGTISHSHLEHDDDIAVVPL